MCQFIMVIRAKICIRLGKVKQLQASGGVWTGEGIAELQVTTDPGMVLKRGSHLARGSWPSPAWQGCREHLQLPWFWRLLGDSFPPQEGRED